MGDSALGSSLLENFSNTTFSLRVCQILPVTHLPETCRSGTVAQLTSSLMPFIPISSLWKQLLPQSWLHRTSGTAICMLPKKTTHLSVPSATGVSTMHSALQETHFHRRKGIFLHTKNRARDRLVLPICYSYL